MPNFPFQYAAERSDPFPPVATLSEVDASTALDAAHAALAQFPPTLTTPAAWLRVVLTTHPKGAPHGVLSVPLTATGQIPLDWSAPFAVERDDDE